MKHILKQLISGKILLNGGLAILLFQGCIGDKNSDTTKRYNEYVAKQQQLYAKKATSNVSPSVPSPTKSTPLQDISQPNNTQIINSNSISSSKTWIITNEIDYLQVNSNLTIFNDNKIVLKYYWSKKLRGSNSAIVKEKIDDWHWILEQEETQDIYHLYLLENNHLAFMPDNTSSDNCLKRLNGYDRNCGYGSWHIEFAPKQGGK